MKSSILKMHENCEGSISSTRRTRSSKKPSRTRVRNWKHRWLPLCLATLLRTIRIVGVVHPIKSNQNLRVFQKLVNLLDCVWETHCRLIMKTILQEKETTHFSITGSQIYSHAASHENSRCKGSSGQGMRKIRQHFGVEPDESQK